MITRKGELFFTIIGNSSTVLGFAPYQRLAFLLTTEDKERLEKGLLMDLPTELLEMLLYYGVLQEDANSRRRHRSGSAEMLYPGSRMTFLMTSRCNLQCTYCYAEAGSDLVLQPTIAYSAVNQFFAATQGVGRSSVVFKFHGVGEPTMAFWEMQHIVRHIQERSRKTGIKTWLSMTTNGVFSPEICSWIGQNFQHVTVSCDGVATVQDKQRPTREGDPSSPIVYDNLAYLASVPLSLGVRATVTPDSVATMSDCVSFLSDIGVKKINFEPVSMVGFGEQEHFALEPHVFVTNYMKAKEVGFLRGVHVSYSGVDPSRPLRFHCGAYGQNYVLTPYGDISLCYEVFRREHPLYKHMVIGKVTEEVSFDRDKLGSATCRLPRECETCFARGNCAGGCLARRQASNPLGKKSFRIKCRITREILRQEIITILREHQAKWYLFKPS